MGIRSYVRDRKQVKADRAESGSHQKLVKAMTPAKRAWTDNGGGANPSTNPNLNFSTPDSWSHTDGKSFSQAQGDADRYNAVKWDD